ncbi:hypothetical protein [Glycomyces buryatensis]|uniref:GH26 domain-containing protein n=1 Tax=Glycomyces buryatensis TaxID=2570927 RepID=A0A4S8QI31_9ACTN|nr:hypothetical protein [Glycomyces buryatensis]THV42912.1 hypothetical protein FAB82_03960 [Glycomyces buryatensis]
MNEPTRQPGLPLRTGRGIVTLMAALPLVLAGFVIGYGTGVDRAHTTETVPESWRGGEGTVDHSPVAATFTATSVSEPAPDAPTVLPVGQSDDLGISVTHLQFGLDESTVRPDHTAELRMPVALPPDSEGMMLEVSSVRPVDCLCSLTAESAPPYGRVWDAVLVDSTTTEIVFDISGAIDAPGYHGFAITSPDNDSYLELQGTTEEGSGPRLRTISTPAADPSASPPTDPPASPYADPTGEPTPVPTTDSTSGPTSEPTAGPAGPGIPEAGQAQDNLNTCTTGDKLIPTCGALVGAAAGAHTSRPKEQAFLEFEQTVERTQQIYHAYQRGQGQVFPTPEQIALASDPVHPRTLFINWKPRGATWGEIAAGDGDTDAYLDQLAAHINANFDAEFFLTVHHEPENDVIQKAGSGMEASDYAAMFRYVTEYLREAGVDNAVMVMNYMGYLKWVEKPWHDQLYPGDDVVDWIGLSGYGQSLADDGYSDFTEIIDQTTDGTAWPGFYHWVGQTHPTKPMMLAEWGVFHESKYPGHQAAVFKAAKYQLAHYPRLKAIVYFESPNAEGRNSEVHLHQDTLDAYRDLMRSQAFAVTLE